MTAAEIPSDDPERRAALERSRILDTSAELAFDDFTLLAAQICETPVALVSMIDRRRQRSESPAGLKTAETTREQAFCAQVVAGKELLVVPDVLADARFKDNPLVNGDPGIRFYAGAPLVTGAGYVLGTLCVIDRVPRQLTEPQLAALHALSRRLMAQLEFRRTLAALDQEQQFTQGMMESSTEGMLVVRPDGTVLRANPAVVNLFGKRAEELVGRSIEGLLVDPNRYRPTGTARAGLVSAIGHLTDWEGRRATGEVVPCEVHVWEFGPPGRRLLAVHVRDLSKQRQSERVKKQFVANVSHELRTPLTSLRGALALVRDSDANCDDDTRELLTVARRNADRLLDLVNDLLDLERVGSGQLAVDKRDCGLAAAIDRAADTVRPIAADAGVSLKIAPTAVQLHADPDRLTQVMINLLANAVRFSPRGGTVTVGVSQDANRVRVTVDDQGPGVPELFRAAIFQPFTQVEGSAAHKKGGTGLGLSISSAIVKEHQGVLDVADAPGGGARFWFDLPA